MLRPAAGTWISASTARMKIHCETCNRDLDIGILGLSEQEAKQFHNLVHQRKAVHEAIKILRGMAKSMRRGNPTASKLEGVAALLAREDYISPPAAEAGQPAVSNPVCSHCGKPKDHPRHVKFVVDLDNPVKHKFEPAAEAGQPSPASKPKCRIGWHQVTYSAETGAWCKKCKMEADMEVCRENRAAKPAPSGRKRHGTKKVVPPSPFEIPMRDTLQ